MNPKTWSDQPAAVEQAAVHMSLFIDRPDALGLSVEVRKLDESYWYVTAGTLFGSQTLRCASACVVLDVLAVIMDSAKTPKKSRSLPDGATIVEP